MQRRHFLAGAVGIAAAPLAAKAGPGSSLAPVGRVSTTAWCPQGYKWDGDGCVRTSWPWMGSYWPEWLGAINTLNVAIGSKSPRPYTYPISGLDDPWFRAQLDGTQFADLSDLRDLLTYGAAIGGSWGLRRAGTRGAAVGAIFGAEFGAALWLGYNIGVVAQRLPFGSTAPPPITGGAVSYNGTGYQTSGVGSYGGVGSGGWIVIQVSGGGGDRLFNELF